MAVKYAPLYRVCMQISQSVNKNYRLCPQAVMKYHYTLFSSLGNMQTKFFFHCLKSISRCFNVNIQQKHTFTLKFVRHF